MTYNDDETQVFLGKIVAAVARWQRTNGPIKDNGSGRLVVEITARSAQRLLVLDGELPDDLTPVGISWTRDREGRSEPKFYFEFRRRTDEEMRRMKEFCAEEIAKIEGMMKTAAADRCSHCGQLMGDRR